MFPRPKILAGRKVEKKDRLWCRKSRDLSHGGALECSVPLAEPGAAEATSRARPLSYRRWSKHSTRLEQALISSAKIAAVLP